jgi:hypothetical protein
MSQLPLFNRDERPPETAKPAAPPRLVKVGASGLAPAPRDPRLDDLRAMGLQRVWLHVAEEIGVDQFLALWRIIDADPQSSYDSATLRVPLLGWRTYLRYQRNRYIEQLRDMGRDALEIQRRLNRQMGERISLPHIKRIMAGR